VINGRYLSELEANVIEVAIDDLILSFEIREAWV
jgi:hypothetical protein